MARKHLMSYVNAPLVPKIWVIIFLWKEASLHGSLLLITGNRMNLSKMATQCSSIMDLINGLVVNVMVTVTSEDAQVSV